VERHIESLQHSITLFNCVDEKINAVGTLTVENFLVNLRNDSKNKYTGVNEKIIKRNILIRKDEKCTLNYCPIIVKNFIKYKEY
jgi:hypothetical protein